MSPGTLYLVAWKFLWAVLLLYSVREVVGDIACSIKNNQDPRNYLGKDVVEIALKNITIHKGHSSNSWQVLNCTCEDTRVSLYFKACATNAKICENLPSFLSYICLFWHENGARSKS